MSIARTLGLAALALGSIALVGCGDADGDGLSNSKEKKFGSDKDVADSDGDGVPDGCDSADPGFGYYEATTLTGGLFLSICNNDWGPTLTSLAELAVDLQLVDRARPVGQQRLVGQPHHQFVAIGDDHQQARDRVGRAVQQHVGQQADGRQQGDGAEQPPPRA